MRRVLGLRARFVGASGLFVLTTIAASGWTLVALTDLGAAVNGVARDADQATAATSGLAYALEREDDALLAALDDPAGTAASLRAARQATDAERADLRGGLPADDRGRVDAVDALVDDYRAAVDASLAAADDHPLAAYHGEVNPRLRQAVAAVRQVRVHQFERIQASAGSTVGQVGDARRAVVVISVAATAVAVAVALWLAQIVLTPLGRLSRATHALREGDFDARVALGRGDELGEVAAAFDDMAARIAEFRRSDLGAVLAAKGALEATLAALPDAVLVLDRDGRVTAANPAAEQLFRGLGVAPPATAADVGALGIDVARLDAALRGQASGDRVDLDAALAVGDADPRRLAVRVAPSARERDGGGAVVVLSDVTELARLHEMRRELVAVASHELRTPLTTLAMSLHMLREAADGLPPRARELVANAAGGVAQLQGTVDELLDMTSIEAGHLKLADEAVDVRALVGQAIARAAPRAEELGISLVAHLPPDAPAVRGDRARLRIVLDNLLENALKYTPASGSVAVDVEPADDAGVALIVTDTGCGVPDEYRDRVFDKFFRVEHHRPRGEAGPRGTGIGLYMAREIVTRHGGAIACRAVPGQRGARFVVSLPAAPL